MERHSLGYYCRCPHAGLFHGRGCGGRVAYYLLYLKGGSFGQTDPLFHNDIGFYVFELPLYRLLRGWALVLLVLTAIGAAGIYLMSNYEQLARRFSGQVTMAPGAGV